MKRIYVSDMTLVKSNNLSFKEKIEIARQLDNLKVDVIELDKIKNITADTLLIKTVSAFVKNSAISVGADLSKESIDSAAAALSNAKSGRIRVCLPVSPTQMEYFCHMKPKKVLETAVEVLKYAGEKYPSIELFLMDATRADKAFLAELAQIAVNNKVKVITVCDDEGVMLPDDFAVFITSLKKDIPVLNEVTFGVQIYSKNELATASCLLAIKNGADEIKGSVVCPDFPKINLFGDILNQGGEKIGATAGLNFTELQRITKQVKWIMGVASTQGKGDLAIENNAATVLDTNDTKETVAVSVKKLGYDLSNEDIEKVYEEFKRVAAIKKVGSKELDAIVASVALQVPPTYKLLSYIINNGNIITASAQIKLEKNGEEISGISTGDGPVDASFRALEQIIGHHYELDDFQIQSVTEGREAMGSALVKLRHNGKLYSGNGISTDIIGSSIRAYINAVNKIVYEEE